MICPSCHGTGKLTFNNRVLPGGPYVYPGVPCPECHGSGRQSCCDTAGAGIAEGGKAKPESGDA